MVIRWSIELDPFLATPEVGNKNSFFFFARLKREISLKST